MNPGPPDWFEVRHVVAWAGGLLVLRLDPKLRLVGPSGSEAMLTFRVDTGADVSMIPEGVAFGLGLRLDAWPPTARFRTATGGPMRSRRARGVRYEFDRLPGYRFRTDFAVSPDLKGRDGLLAWRDLALDFDIRTTDLPHLVVNGPVVAGRPGTVRLCLRSDRSPDRVG